MSSFNEVLLTSESSGQLWNVCCWDVNSGTHISTYKGGSSTPHTLCSLKQDYLLSAVSNKPILHVWALQKREQIQQRIICPGHVTSLTSSPDGLYVVGAVQEKLHVWQVSTGNLLAVLHKHYQTIRCLKFTDDGSHFISGADDNMVLVWSLWRVVDEHSERGSSGIEPRHTWSQHSLPITDLHVGIGSVQARVFSSSLDQTCKIWELASGSLLCNIIFECSITSVIVDNGENKLYAGGHNGHIYVVNLHQKPARTELHISDNDISSAVMRGHSKQVCCLCLAMDGHSLISGSHDQNVCIWDILSGQCVKTLSHKGNITNLMVCGMPPGLQNPDYKTKLPLQLFKRFLHNSNESIDQHGQDGGVVPVRIKGSQQKITDIDIKEYIEELDQSPDEEEADINDRIQTRLKDLEKEVKDLKTINKQIYNFAIEKIISEKK